jgi:hypothetical protein
LSPVAKPPQSPKDEVENIRPWQGSSVANQRYQFHVIFSSVPLGPEAHGHSQEPEVHFKTGGAGTDTLIPGDSASFTDRWAPRLVDERALASTAGFRDGVRAPLTASEFAARAPPRAQAAGCACERQGPLGLGSKNAWDADDCCPWIAVADGGRTLRAAYSGVRARSGLARAREAFSSGRHYWEVTLRRFGVGGQGRHCVGVAGPELPREAAGDFALGASAERAAGLCLQHCEAVQGARRPAPYGRASCQEGDVSLRPPRPPRLQPRRARRSPCTPRPAPGTVSPRRGRPTGARACR